MPLKREHLVSWRVNWHPKSANLKELAGELGLGLDSFIFIDDNPLECAEVRSHCPEVLTLQLPQDEEGMARFLNHVWAFELPLGQRRIPSQRAQPAGPGLPRESAGGRGG